MVALTQRAVLSMLRESVTTVPLLSGPLPLSPLTQKHNHSACTVRLTVKAKATQSNLSNPQGT